MTIDFHTHIFPDHVAPKALGTILDNISGLYPPVSDGTVAGLLRNMDAWGIDLSVLQPVVTKQSQTYSTNKWVSSVCTSRLMAFGGIYPHTDDYKRDIDYVAGLGLKGLKFHPEYQDYVVDDPKMLKIYDYALSRGLMILFHAGIDPGFPPPYKSSPRQFAAIVEAMRGGVLIAAHLGGHAQWDDVEKYLVGQNIYLDTSMGLDFYPHQQFLRIVKDHGAEKILFASDSPWSSAGEEIERLKKLPLTQHELELILGQNAQRLLGID